MLGKRAEDYIEAIYELSKEKGFAKVKDIAKALKVKPATVSEMLEKLSDSGYVIYKKRFYVMLTDKGKKLAEDVRKRREILIKFLTTIGVSREVAEKDACMIEHVLHPETVEQLRNFVEFIENSPSVNPKWLEHFKEYCKTGKHPCSPSCCL